MCLSCSPRAVPVDEHLMELLLMIDALKRASARRITAVIPYYGYARQDRKDKPRVPISSKLVADLLTTAGADRALVVDLHAPQIAGLLQHSGRPLVRVARAGRATSSKLNLPNLTVVSPDAGGVERARFFAKKMDAALAIVDKRRVEMNVAEVMHVIGDVHGRTCLVIDDLIDTAGTLVKTAAALLENGATAVYACCSHPVLFRSGDRKHFEIRHHASGGHQHDSAERGRAARAQDSQALDRGADWPRHSVHPRGNFGQQIIQLGKNKLWQPSRITTLLKRSREPLATRTKLAAFASRRKNSGRGLWRRAGLSAGRGGSPPGHPHPQFGNRPQHDFRSDARWRQDQGHDRRLAVRAHQGQAAAHRREADRHGQETGGHGARSNWLASQPA